MLMSLMYRNKKNTGEFRKAAVRAVFFIFLVFLLIPDNTSAREWSLAPDSEHSAILGKLAEYTIKDDEMTLVKLARRYDLGYNEITLANPGIDPWYPTAGKKAILPTSWIIPRAVDPDRSRPLIVVNLGELRLYFLNPGENSPSVALFPVGVGRQGFETVAGRYWITEKRKNPYWTIPSSLRDEYPDESPRIPPGPSNPLGDYALRLSRHDYLIHGTNKPLGIGRRISHGCIRMYPGDIERLYGMVSESCEVLIVYETVKVGVRDGTPFIEVHPDYLHDSDQQIIARHLLIQQKLWEKTDHSLLKKAVAEKKGIPVPLK